MLSKVTSFHGRVGRWLEACFPPQVRADRGERMHRFRKKALELVQANGCSCDDADARVEYVVGRSQGQLGRRLAV